MREKKNEKKTKPKLERVQTDSVLEVKKKSKISGLIPSPRSDKSNQKTAPGSETPEKLKSDLKKKKNELQRKQEKRKTWELRP